MVNMDIVLCMDMDYFFLLKRNIHYNKFYFHGKYK